MNRLVNHIRLNRFYYITLAVAAAVFYVMNLLTTLKGDEYVYALVPDNPRRLCTSLWDFVRTMPFFYQDTNGRLADVFERLMASLMGKQVFNVLNTLVFIAFIEGVMTLTACRRRSVLLLLAALAGIAVFPKPGETMLWQAGACNYLWATTLTLWLMVWLARRENRPRSTSTYITAFVFALAAGAMNEATSTAMLAGWVIYMIFNWRKADALLITAFAGYLLGLCVILGSPGLWWRLGLGSSVNLEMGVLATITRRLVMLPWISLRLVVPLVAIVVILVRMNRVGFRAMMSDRMVCGVVGAIVAGLVLGMVIERPYFFYATMCLAVVLGVAEPWLRRHALAVGVAFVFGLSAFAASTIYYISDYRAFDHRIMSQIQNGPAECVIEGDSWPHRHLWVMPDVFSNEEHGCYYRNAYAQYFGKTNVQFLSPLMLDRYEAGLLTQGAVEIPVVSSNPAFARRLLAVEGQPYMLIPVENTEWLGNGFGHVSTDYAYNELDEQTRLRRQLLGTLLTEVAMRPYYLHDARTGRYYFVVGMPYDPTVSRLSFDFYDLDNLEHTLTLTVKPSLI